MEIVLNSKCFSKYVSLIHELTGITVANNRTSLVEGRLRKRLKFLDLSYEDYLELVKADVSEQIHFIDLVTTNETSFFRTPRIWNYMENIFLPEWYKNNPQKIFSIWSAACSSGEEAHSLGIMCQVFKESHPTFNYSILGTDISQDMIKKCQKGEYSHKSVSLLKAANRSNSKSMSIKLRKVHTKLSPLLDLIYDSRFITSLSPFSYKNHSI